MRPPRFLAAGDTALLVELGDEIDPETHQRVRRLFLVLREKPLAGVLEVVPAYRSILVQYDPLAISVEEMERYIEDLDRAAEDQTLPPPRTIEIPVAYGGVFGPDLEFVAQFHDLTPKEIIQIHSATEYLVYLVGFSPGFPFLGRLDERIRTPRLETPRTHVPRGSVAIANEQTGIYPVDSPGGWRIIGRTPLRLYRPEVDPPVLVETGDRVRFVPISEVNYHRISGGYK